MCFFGNFGGNFGDFGRQGPTLALQGAQEGAQSSSETIL